MPNTTLVTGGAGFVGSHLCESLLEKGERVLCLDNFSSGSQTNISHLHDDNKFKIINRDVRAPGSLPSVDQIYHLASRASPTDFTKFPVNIALANTKGTREMLDHARACDARMVFASTSEVYGDPKEHPQSETYNGNVNIRGVRGCYDESKRFGETLTVAYRREYNLDVRTVRIFNTYGPRMRPDDGRVVPTFLTQALRGEDLTIHGEGTQTRSFCFVDDLVDGIETVMNATNLEHSVYNVGNDNEITIQKLAELVVDVTDSSSEFVYEPRPEDDPTQRCPDLTRTFNDLNWSSKIGVEEGLEITSRYFRRLTDENRT